MKTENRGGVRTSLTKKIGRPTKDPTRVLNFRVPVKDYERLKVLLREFLNYSVDLNDILLSDIENVLERNLLMRDENSETVEKIIELFKNSNRPQLKWHFKNNKNGNNL